MREVRHFAERFRPLYSKPEYQYFVTVLLGLMECDGRRTLSGMLREVGQSPSLSGLSWFLTEAPWCSEAVVASWQRHFRAEMQPLVTAEREQQRHQQPKRRGRPKQPLVTGYVIGDDSTVFLEEEQQRLRVLWQRPVSIGEARREIQRRHRRCLLEWLHHQFLSGVHPESLFELFAA